MNFERCARPAVLVAGILAAHVAVAQPAAPLAGLQDYCFSAPPGARHVPMGKPDRYGWPRTLLFLPGAAQSVQANLLRQGLARMQIMADADRGAARLLAAELAARRDQRGLWATQWRIIAAEDADHGIGNFHLVRGRVKSVSAVKKGTYVNFGDDWRVDFTLRLSKTATTTLAKQGRPPKSWIGHEIIARGWLRHYNGAFMDIDTAWHVEGPLTDAHPPRGADQAAPTPGRAPAAPSHHSNANHQLRHRKH